MNSYDLLGSSGEAPRSCESTFFEYSEEEFKYIGQWKSSFFQHLKILAGAEFYDTIKNKKDCYQQLEKGTRGEKKKLERQLRPG